MNNEIEKIGSEKNVNLNLEQKIDFLATTFGRDVIAAVEYCADSCKSWYENGKYSHVSNLIAEDDRYEEYLEDIIDGCADIDDDKEFWHSVSACLSSLVIDGLPDYMLTEEELEELYG